MKRFNWMVYDHVDKEGIWFLGTQKNSDFHGEKVHGKYVFYWNPLKVIAGFITGNWTFGWFPFKTKHINFF